MKKVITIFILIFITASLWCDNPLFGGSTASKNVSASSDSLQRTDGKTASFAKLKLSILKIQKELYLKMYSHRNDAKTWKGFLWLLVIAFSYGFLHALGPGHGKFFLTGYFISNKRSVLRSIIGGLTIGFLHAFSGALLAIVLYFILHLPVNSSSDSLRNILEIISYALLFLLGVYSLIKAVAKNGQTHENVSFWGLVLSVGLIPCPGAIMLSLFGITILNNIWHTLLIIAVMGTGMSLAISLFSLIPTLLQKIEIPVLKKPVFSKILPVTGALIITAISGLLILSKI